MSDPRPDDNVTRLPCPTCQGSSRETVGMVCQTCGTDYAPRLTRASITKVGSHSDVVQVELQYDGRRYTGTLTAHD